MLQITVLLQLGFPSKLLNKNQVERLVKVHFSKNLTTKILNHLNKPPKRKWGNKKLKKKSSFSCTQDSILSTDKHR